MLLQLYGHVHVRTHGIGATDVCCIILSTYGMPFQHDFLYSFCLLALSGTYNSVCVPCVMRVVISVYGDDHGSPININLAVDKADFWH